MVYSTDRSKAVVLLFVALWFILRGYLFYVLPCVILFLCFFSPFSIAITLLVEERANVSVFRTFVRFALVLFCLFPLSLGVWEGLRFVIVAPLDFSHTSSRMILYVSISSTRQQPFSDDIFHFEKEFIPQSAWLYCIRVRLCMCMWFCERPI